MLTSLIQVRLRQEIHQDHKNILPIRCALHHFNLIAKDLSKLTFAKDIIKVNCRLVTFFTSSHIRTAKLREWMKDQPGPHRYLRTLCETRWYSLILVCLGVQSFEQGFQYCVEQSGVLGNPQLPPDIIQAIRNRYHFAKNNELTVILKPVIDSIGRLEGGDSTLGDVMAEFCYIRFAWMHLDEITSPDAIRFKEEGLRILSRRAKQYDQEIYFIAFFLCSKYKRVAISGNWTFRRIWNSLLSLVKAWGYTVNDVEKLRTEISQYHNHDELFIAAEGLPQGPRAYWDLMIEVPTLRKLALKVFAIVPHGAAVERLFSILSLSKSKIRNKLSIDTMKQIAMMRAELKKNYIQPTVGSRLSSFNAQNEIRSNIAEVINNDEEEINDHDQEQLHDDIRIWELDAVGDLDEENNIEEDILAQFFNFDLYYQEIVNPNLGEGNMAENVNRRDEKNWSIEQFMI